MRIIKSIIIHSSGTPNGVRKDVNDIDAMDWAAGRQRNEQLIGFNQPRLKHIGVHFVVYVNGAVCSARGAEEIGEHTPGFDSNSLGVCLVGTDRFTVEQFNSLKIMCRGLRKKYLTIQREIGASELIGGNSPGFDVSEWIANDYQILPAVVCDMERNHGL